MTASSTPGLSEPTSTPTEVAWNAREQSATLGLRQVFGRDRTAPQEPMGVTPQARSWVRACSSKRPIASVTAYIEGLPFSRV